MNDLKKNKIAYIKIGNFSYTNVSVHKILVEKFPEFQIVVFDVLKNLLSKREILISMVYSLIEYGKEILAGKRTVSGSYIRTSYFFKIVKKRIAEMVSPQDYVFTFQTQSLFDASVPGIPHFLYTDHTHLANLSYPGFDKDQLLKGQFIDREKMMYQNAILNFTMSQNISQSIIDDYNCKLENVKCVFCGSNVQVAYDEIFEEKRFYEKRILFVGVEWERKGGPVMIEAFNKVLKKHPDATLTIVGCSPKITVKNCTIVGRIPIDDVKKYFRNSSVFCLPTTIEPLGIAFLEAMAHKLPVVGSNIGAIPDFIKDGTNGYLIEPDNPDQIAEKLITLLDSPSQCKKFGEIGHQMFWDNYTWNKTGEKIFDSISRVMEQ